MSHDFNKTQFTIGHTSCHGHFGGKGDCASRVKEDASSFAEFLGADKRPKHPHREHVRNHDEPRGSHRACENTEHRPRHECGPPPTINKFVFNTVICRSNDSPRSDHCAEEPLGNDKVKHDHGSVGCHDGGDNKAHAKHAKRPEPEPCDDMKGPNHRHKDDAPGNRPPPNRSPMMLADDNRPRIEPASVPRFTHMPVLIGDTPNGSGSNGSASSGSTSPSTAAPIAVSGNNTLYATNTNAYAEQITSGMESLDSEVTLATIAKIEEDAQNALESMKQQTLGKHVSNSVKNSNLTSY